MLDKSHPLFHGVPFTTRSKARSKQPGRDGRGAAWADERLSCCSESMHRSFAANLALRVRAAKIRDSGIDLRPAPWGTRDVQKLSDFSNRPKPRFFPRNSKAHALRPGFRENPLVNFWRHAA